MIAIEQQHERIEDWGREVFERGLLNRSRGTTEQPLATRTSTPQADPSRESPVSDTPQQSPKPAPNAWRDAVAGVARALVARAPDLIH